MDKREVPGLMRNWLTELINLFPAEKFSHREGLDRYWVYIYHKECGYIQVKIEPAGMSSANFRIDMKGIVDDNFLGLRNGLLKRVWPYKFIPDIELTEKGFSVSPGEVAEKIISAFEKALTWSKKVLEAEVKYNQQLRQLREQAHKEVFGQE